MATGYSYHNGVQVSQPVDYDNDYPGGSIVSTAEDMSHAECHETSACQIIPEFRQQFLERFFR
jgi:hypothetical protein